MTDLIPFPEKCPHCGAAARYESSKEMIDGKHLYGQTTWECGYSFSRLHDEVFGHAIETEPGRCRRVAR